jgi:hypothetical protein
VADSVVAAAEAVVAGTQIDMAAEREAKDVADAVTMTEKSVVAAALMAAEAASHARDRKADAAATTDFSVSATASATSIASRSAAMSICAPATTASAAAKTEASADDDWGPTPEAAPDNSRRNASSPGSRVWLRAINIANAPACSGVMVTTTSSPSSVFRCARPSVST